MGIFNTEQQKYIVQPIPTIIAQLKVELAKVYAEEKNPESWLNKDDINVWTNEIKKSIDHLIKNRGEGTWAYLRPCGANIFVTKNPNPVGLNVG